MSSITSQHLKAALMAYFRFKRQWLCADEVCYGYNRADLIVITNNGSLEVEIKVNKFDLINGEENKTTGYRFYGAKKHKHWSINNTNKFALCVPEDLEEEAQKWIQATNKNYGLFIYLDNQRWYKNRIYVKRSAKLLHSETSKVEWKDKIIKRLCSARANDLIAKINK